MQVSTLSRPWPRKLDRIESLWAPQESCIEWAQLNCGANTAGAIVLCDKPSVTSVVLRDTIKWTASSVITTGHGGHMCLNIGLRQGRGNTRWFKYDRDKLWLVYTQSVPVIFEPPCMCIIYWREYDVGTASVLTLLQILQCELTAVQFSA